MLWKDKKGQSTLEYAILVIIIIAALVSLQTYVKRGLQGRLKSATDDIGDGFSQANSSNYHKRVVSISNTVDALSEGVSNTSLRSGGKMTTETTSGILMNADGEYWGKK